MIKYMLICTTNIIDGITYATYGIKTFNSEISIEDISTNKSKVVQIINLLNDLGDVAPIHLKDIIEDYLVDLCI